MKKTLKIIGIALGLGVIGAAFATDRQIRSDHGNLNIKLNRDGGGKMAVEGNLQVTGSIIADGGVFVSDFGLGTVDPGWNGRAAPGFCAGTCDQAFAIWDPVQGLQISTSVTPLVIGTNLVSNHSSQILFDETNGIQIVPKTGTDVNIEMGNGGVLCMGINCKVELTSAHWSNSAPSPSFDNQVAMAKGIKPTRQTLDTCGVSIEGAVESDTVGGASGGHRTRLCACTSDGAGSPVYKWQNIVTGTLGNTTTCAD